MKVLWRICIKIQKSLWINIWKKIPYEGIILKLFHEVTHVYQNILVQWKPSSPDTCSLKLFCWIIILTTPTGLQLIILEPSTAMGQAVACAPGTQRAGVPSPVGTSFLGEVFSVVFLIYKNKCQEALGPHGSTNIIWPS